MSGRREPLVFYKEAIINLVKSSKVVVSDKLSDVEVRGR